MMNSRWFRNGLVYVLILVAVLALAFNFFSPSTETQTLPISQVAQLIKDSRVSHISISSDELTITQNDGTEARSLKERGIDLADVLAGFGVTETMLASIEIEVEPPSQLGNWVGLLSSLLPVFLFGGLLLFMMRQAQSGNNQALSFGKSRARMFTGDRPTVTFADVAGVEEAKVELQEVVEFLKEPEKFIALGARIPKGVLMVGPPGCGKTLMARAVAGEAEVPFFNISGSEFVEMFVGVGASRVRDLFEQAKRNSPSLVFVDEIDAVGRHRGAGLGGSHDEREQTLNQILVEMDGFDTDTNVIIIAATNRPDILDPALLRPGRFDRQVVLDRPDIRGRQGILEIHIRGKPVEKEVDLESIAKQTPGFTGADIENLVNEAAILAARRDKKAISTEELEESIEKVLLGPERKSRIMSEHEKSITAHHEAGHAVVAKLLPHCDPLHKVSIIARGMAGGYTLTIPEDDLHYVSRSKFEDDIAMMLGGRAAEELIFEEVTTGAMSDLERATSVARRMVTEFGMSDKLGPMTFGRKEELVFLGREIGEQRNYSEKVAQAIDDEVQRIIGAAHSKAKDVLTKHKETLVRMAQRLMEVETLDADALEAVFAAS
ncbi:MAG: ATP-dependent zinc metalloprotease FtsH [Anaerolineae bacterium]